MTHSLPVLQDCDRIARIRALNDEFRRNARGGSLIFSRSIEILGGEYVARVREAVAEFDAFAEFDEADGEHDIGCAEVDGAVYFWIIDYYDLNRQFRSEDPSDPARTVRTLTVVRLGGF